MMKRLAVLLALAGGMITHAWPQTYQGQLPANTVLGNSTGSPLPFPTPGQVVGGQIASGTVTNPNLANMAGRTLKGVQGGTTGPPQDILVSQLAYPTVFAYGASGSTQSTTGTITAAQSTLTLAAAIDFANGQGIRVAHAGAAFATNPPTAASATPVGTPGGTTYTYQVSSIDFTGGIGAAIATFTTATGNASLTTANYNALSWSAPGAGPTPAGYAVYGRIGGALVLIGTTATTTFADQGQTAPFSPDWIPSTPPGAALADSLLTTISSGGGTTTLTLAASATTNATTQFVGHDDSAAIQACLNAASSTGLTCFVPPTFTYNVGAPITLPTTGAVTLLGGGRGGQKNSTAGAGTILNGTQALSAIINTSTSSFATGHRVSNMTIKGNTIVQIPMQIDLLGTSTLDLLDILDAAITNFRLGTSGKNPIENTIFDIRLDNGLNSHVVPNLPIYDFDVIATNNNIGHVKAVNAKTANWHTTSGASSNNTFNAIHGYNFDYTAAQATGPVNNFLLEGLADQIINWEADGSSTANVQINGFQNILSNGVSQFQSPLAAQIGVRFGASTCQNSVLNNIFLNSTAANTVVGATTPCTPGNLVWQNQNGTNNTLLGLSVDDIAHVRAAAGGIAAPTLTAGCNGAGSSVRADSTDFSGQVTGQTAAATTCTITFANAFRTTVAPRCVVSGQTVAPTTVVPTASTLVINFASTATAVFNWICFGI